MVDVIAHVARGRRHPSAERLTDGEFAVEAIRKPGYDDPDEYETDYGSFVPELMAKVPPTIVYAAQK